MGYDSQFFRSGDDIFFEDFNIEYNRKWSKSVRTIFSYVFLNYNKDVIEGRDGFGHVYSHTGIIETIWKIVPKKTLRTELQHLYTEQDKQSWACILAEYTISPKWSFAAFDQYNYGNTHTNAAGDYDQRLHYYTGTNDQDIPQFSDAEIEAQAADLILHSPACSPTSVTTS